jgi:hypothetical protein
MVVLLGTFPPDILRRMIVSYKWTANNLGGKIAAPKDAHMVADTVNVLDFAGFCAAFGALGSSVGPRTGGDKRTKDEKEWFVVRRFLKIALRDGFLKAPISIQKQDPPLPDFGLQIGDAIAHLEITEATDPADQREMTVFEQSGNSAMLLGTFGGRFSDGASQPGRAWASDVMDAIERKGGKAIFQKSDMGRHLVIYPNSNASMLLFDADDERDAFGFLGELIAARAHGSVLGANGCLVHVLGMKLVGFDVLGEARLAPR